MVVMEVECDSVSFDQCRRVLLLQLCIGRSRA